MLSETSGCVKQLQNYSIQLEETKENLGSQHSGQERDWTGMMMAYGVNHPSTWDAEQVDCYAFRTGLDYVDRPFLKREKM